MDGPTIRESKDPTHLNFKTTPAGAEWITKMATQHNTTITEVVRQALKVAAIHEGETSRYIDQKLKAAHTEDTQ